MCPFCKSQLCHVLDSMFDECEEIPLEHFVVPFVVVDGSKIFKITLVGQLNGNPTLSKDRMTIIKFGMLYTKPKKKISRASDNEFNLGCGCVVAFVIEATLQKQNKKCQANQKH